jgi:hypothetical protein
MIEKRTYRIIPQQGNVAIDFFMGYLKNGSALACIIVKDRRTQMPSILSKFSYVS